jgi:site-specific DNA-methyltransferase (adenine-specific)
MANDLIVNRLNGAVRLLAEASNAREAKVVADLARAAEIYAQRQKLGDEAIAHATTIKVDALTQMGEFLRRSPKNHGTNGQLRGREASGGRSVQPPEDSAPTLAEAGISKQESSSAQALAAIKEEDPELHEKVRSGEVPVGKAVQQARRQKQDDRKRQQMRAKAATGLPSDLWRIIHGDAVVEVPRLPERPRQIVTDPMYNIGVDYGKGPKADLLPESKYLAGVGAWMKLCHDALTDDGSLWVLINWENAARYELLLQAAGFTIRSRITWYETFGVNCSGNFNRTSRRLFYCVKDPNRFVFHPEAVSRPSARQVVYNDGRAAPAGKLWDDVWAIPRLPGTSKERIPGFPTQLPLELLRPIIEVASDPGDLVVDLFSGSASTGAAALELGRRYVGIEEIEEFVELSRLRLAAQHGAGQVADGSAAG